MKDSRLSTASAVAASPTRTLAPARTLAVYAAGTVTFAALMALATHMRVPLPFTPVPVTLQTGVALLAGVTLGPIAGAAAMALYLLAGAGLGILPAGALLGPTAGYLFAFVPAALAAGWLSRRGWLGMAGGMVLASVLIYACGAAWLATVTHTGFRQAVALGVVPFLFGDTLKLIAAAAASRLTVPVWRSALRGR